MLNMRHLRGVGISRSENISAMFAPPVPPQADLPLPPEPDLTIHHYIVLLKLRGGDAAKALLAKFTATKIGEPSRTDWSSMISAGYVARSPSGYLSQHSTGRLTITPPGNAKLRTATRDLCIRYNVHVFTRTGGRGTNLASYSRCSCGGFARGPEPNDNAGQSRLRHAEDMHLRDVEKKNSISNLGAPPALVEIVSPGAIASERLAVTVPGMNLSERA